jgi:AraC family transcriptional regulator of adaptative response/methylated-DNA-[protein]-cysteine methyltransferase
VQFFAQPGGAEAAGFRACQRCHPQLERPPEPHLALIEQLCRRLDDPEAPAPTLDELAAEFNLSPYHLQRTFKRIVGVTPRQYAEARRLERLKSTLGEGETVTAALYDAGYASSSSLYEQTHDQLGMTPGRYRAGGVALQISYAITPCALGFLLVAATDAGLCAVRLGDSPAALEGTLRAEFLAARLVRNDADLSAWVGGLLAYLEGRQPHLDLPLDIQATAFQRQVWEELRRIPYGSTRSYSAVAQAIGRPSATRAVAGACASNPVALVIPCHRVVREDGHLGGYRWGVERKQALLAQEAALLAQEAE